MLPRGDGLEPRQREIGRVHSAPRPSPRGTVPRVFVPRVPLALFDPALADAELVEGKCARLPGPVLRQRHGRVRKAGGDRHRVALGDEPVEEALRERILEQPLHRATHRPRAEFRREPLGEEQVSERVVHGERHAAADDAPAHGLEHELRDAADFRARQRLEHDDLVEAVQKLRAVRHLKLPADVRLDLAIRRRVGGGVAVDARVDRVQNRLRADVRRHHEHRVREVYGPSFAVREAAVLEDLQEDVEHVRVRFFNLVQKHERVRVPSHRLRELPALLVPDVPGRRPDEPGHREGFHVLAHVDPHHRLLRAVVRRRDRFRELRLPHARGSGENHRRHGAAAVREAAPRASHRPRDRLHRLGLPDDPLRERALDVQERLALVLAELLHRDARPLSDDVGDVGRVDDDVSHPAARRGRGRSELNHRASFVDDVDRLVRQEAVGDVPRGETHRRRERVVVVRHAVVRLVRLLQAVENLERSRGRRLADPHRLKPSLQRRVLLDVLPVLLYRRRADALQLPARERGLHQVPRVHAAVLPGTARAHEHVQLVDEQDDIRRRLHLLDDVLQALLELAAVLCVREE
mmetsp:Transcript_3247/g.10849  ORF Transcript_3247/g.10849 Transcript_3247/m.10849 type:complete len:579 (+) Transcript_3247:544-2280(+)